MARCRKAKGKIVRTLNMNIFGNPKFDRLLSKRPYLPGQHGKTLVRKPSDYGVQLSEKQKAKHFYQMLEKQFAIFFEKANSMKGNTADNLIQLLERRLDVLVFRAGFAPTVASARQLVRHNHFLVNGKKANIPSMVLKLSDTFEVKPKTKEKNLGVIVGTLQDSTSGFEWIDVNKASQSAKLIGVPEKEVAVPFINVNLIVELYSK